LNGRNISQPVARAEPGFSIHPKLFVFFDKKTGAPRFEIKASPDGRMPVDEAVGLLAMHCMVRGQTPSDYDVMVGAGEDLLDGLAGRARKLIQASMAIASPLSLSHRQQEVLGAVLQNLSNKEIGTKLNISERTVKFHVSALLRKFEVPSRVSLMRTALDLLAAGKLNCESPVTQFRARETLRMERSKLDDGLLRLNASERRAAKWVLGETRQGLSRAE
jgi:DNA-binding CsgD family transcriptional regulator